MEGQCTHWPPVKEINPQNMDFSKILAENNKLNWKDGISTSSNPKKKIEKVQFMITVQIVFLLFILSVVNWIAEGRIKAALYRSGILDRHLVVTLTSNIFVTIWGTYEFLFKMS